MDTALRTGELEEVERYAHALEEYTQAEPLPWTDFYVERARALVAYHRGSRDPRTRTSLQRVLDTAEHAQLRVTARALTEALADMGRPRE